MAGLLNKITKEQQPKTSTYIQDLLQQALEKYGSGSTEYKGIFNQYFKMPEIEDNRLVNRRHYEAEMTGNDLPNGLERLYKRTVVIDLLSTCASECVYCLRGYYESFALSDTDMTEIALYCGKDDNLKEVLITGGDPLISFRMLKTMISELAVHAPNIKIVRIGTRLPVQDPYKLNAELYMFFDSMRNRFIFEIACQINHPYELQPKTIEIITNLQKYGCRIYCQNVLLKDVNNDANILIDLYDKLRYLGVSPHYLFHAVPMQGTNNFRTSVAEGLELIKELTTKGEISGRAKPQFALMTDIGKVTIYQGSIVNTEGNYIIIGTKYRLEDRIKWNPNYKLPDSAIINDDGTLSVKYLDANS